MRTAGTLDWPWKDSSVTVGSCVASSSRKERKSTINSLLERLHADAPVGVEEALSLLPPPLVDVGRFFDVLDNAVFIEAGPTDLAQAWALRSGSAAAELKIFGYFAVHPHNSGL